MSATITFSDYEINTLYKIVKDYAKDLSSDLARALERRAEGVAAGIDPSICEGELTNSVNLLTLISFRADVLLAKIGNVVKVQ